MSNSIDAAISGIQVSQTGVGVRAHNIANINTERFVGSRVDQVSQDVGVSVSAVPKTGEDTISDIAALKINKHANSANAKVIHVADEMLGTIIDIKK